jgi:hypothetical protein
MLYANERPPWAGLPSRLSSLIKISVTQELLPLIVRDFNA